MSLDPVVVVGAGAAGLLAAYFAAGGARPVILLERTAEGGRKILISGGGRCNLLPSRFDAAQYTTDSSPHILRNVLRSWPDHAQRRFFERELGIELQLEPETGKLFPASNRAAQVRDTLLHTVRERGVACRFGERVRALAPPAGEAAPWQVRLEDGAVLAAHAVVLATGGLSVPQTGSDGDGLRFAARLGHTVRPTYPALTPLTLRPPRFATLAGVSLEVVVRAPGAGEARGGFLFTHRGYSGPAVLDIAHTAVRARLAGGAQPLLVQWGAIEAPEWERLLSAGAATVAGALKRRLPDRLAEVLLQEAGIAADQRVATLPRDVRRRLLDVLLRFPLPHTGDEGYRKAEVTGGGVALEEVDARSLASRVRPRLFLCGELLDAFGPIGGYNFAWAWATGRLAGLAARES
ncbi:MAG: aminoacetone oxidase family FAD-binding enzyme [Gemmatimonadetes bacterium]|nr:aminoacetone oxidase family FAD-binding enzyme [Gemmatimonadota bacterium]